MLKTNVWVYRCPLSDFLACELITLLSDRRLGMAEKLHLVREKVHQNSRLVFQSKTIS